MPHFDILLIKLNFNLLEMMLASLLLCVPRDKAEGADSRSRSGATSKSPSCNVDDASVQEGNRACFCFALGVNAAAAQGPGRTGDRCSVAGGAWAGQRECGCALRGIQNFP